MELGAISVPATTAIAVDFPSGSTLNIWGTDTVMYGEKESDFSSSGLALNPSIGANVVLQFVGNVPPRLWVYGPNNFTLNYMVI